MKNLITVFIMSALLTGLFSCKNSLDLQQRRYMTGFYVHHPGKKNAAGKHDVSPGKSIAKKEDQVKTPAAEIQKENSEAQAVVVTQPSGEDNSAIVVPAEKSKTKKHKAEKTAAVKTETAVVSNEKPVKSETLKAADAPVGGAQLDDTGMLILELILCVIVPPLAVYLKQKEITKWFWITLILFLLVFTAFYFVFGGLFWFAAVIISLLVVLDILN